MELLIVVLIFLTGYTFRWFTETPISDKISAILFSTLLGLAFATIMSIIIGTPYSFQDKKEVEYEMISDTYKTSRMNVVLKIPHKWKITSNKSWMLYRSDPTRIEVFEITAENTNASPTILIEVK